MQKQLSPCSVSDDSSNPYFPGLEHPRLWFAFKRHGDMHARHKLIELNVPIVGRVVSTFPCPDTEVPVFNRQDLFAWGRVGLVKAVDQFDPERRVRFSTFSYRVIWGEIKEQLRKYYRPAEIDAASLADVTNLEQVHPLSPVFAEPPSSVIDCAIVSQQRDYLKQCLAWLPRPEQAVMVLRFYQGDSVRVTAMKLGIDEKRAKHLQACAIRRIRGWMNADKWSLYSSTPAPDPVRKQYAQTMFGRVTVCATFPLNTENRR